MHRFWAITFSLIPVIAIVTFAMVSFSLWPFETVWYGESLTDSGRTIDGFFGGLHILAAAILAGTGLAIAWCLFRFSHQRHPQRAASYITDNVWLEVVWTAIPAAILIAIAFLQMESWAENKMDRPTMMVDGADVVRPPTVLVRARQFGWEFHYPGTDGEIDTRDDLYVENLLVVPVDTDVVLQLESRDVIHSFFVSELRLKQDIVPGMQQFAWFRANRTGEFDVLCAELCGWGHYKMKARLKIVSPTEYQQWIEELDQQYFPASKP